jgi:tRNA(Ile)-lysidine synthase
MSFKLLHPLPSSVVVAVSGGMDSMSALHFLMQHPERVSHAIHIHHNTGAFADDAQRLVQGYCAKHGINLTIRRVVKEAEEGASKEEHWRDQRYRFFWDEHALHNLPIVLAHNMDDCLENYIVSTMIDGHLGTIPYRHDPCIRPFRLWKRRDIREYAQRNHLPWIEDPSNREYTKYRRAKIRMHIIPRIKNLNPGIYKVVEKMIRVQDERDGV